MINTFLVEDVYFNKHKNNLKLSEILKSKLKVWKVDCLKDCWFEKVLEKG